jgi:hypothetical protein
MKFLIESVTNCIIKEFGNMTGGQMIMFTYYHLRKLVINNFKIKKNECGKD